MNTNGQPQLSECSTFLFQHPRTFVVVVLAHELDIFINNAKHSTFLKRVTRDERRVTSLRHKHVGSQLVETLNKFLSSPDSPAKVSSPSRLHGSSRMATVRRQFGRAISTSNVASSFWISLLSCTCFVWRLHSCDEPQHPRR